VAYGGLGNDTYKVSDSLDTIVEFANEGHDVVHATADFSLSEHVEDLVFLGAGNHSGEGNSGANRLVGNAGDNTLSGAGGDDHVDGGSGHDTLAGGDGSDRLFGGDGDDAIDGGTGSDTLSGGSGADVLTGGAGADFLCGDGGADTFVFRLGDGQDMIKGFDVVEDAITLLGPWIDDVIFTETAAGLRLDYGTEGDAVLLSGLTGDAWTELDISFD
jgi:Ca2+-binding RTX toxin-like protein